MSETGARVGMTTMTTGVSGSVHVSAFTSGPTGSSPLAIISPTNDNNTRNEDNLDTAKTEEKIKSVH